MKTLYFLFLAFTFSIVNAQTNVGGIISNNTTWNASGNPYIVNSDVTINANVTLTIAPGAILKFIKNSDRYDIIVNGTLRAIGTEDSVILFTSNEFIPHPEDWGAIDFKDPSVDYDFNNGTGCVLQYCTFEYGSYYFWPNDAFITMQQSSAYIDHCIFTKIGSVGAITFASDNVELRITNNKFLYISSSLDPVIRLLGVPSSGDISCNLFYADQNNVCSVHGNCNVHNNLFIGNDKLAVDVSSTDHFYGNTIVDNSDVTQILYSSGEVTHNTIARNKVDNTSFVNTLLASFTDTVATITGNNFCYQIPENAVAGFHEIGTYLQRQSYSSLPLNATNNWFNQTNPIEISYLIHDFYDDTSLYKINYQPFLVSPDIDAPITPPTGVNKIDLGGGNVQVSWNPNPDADVAGYKIYWGDFTGYSFSNSIDAGNVTSYTLTNFNFSDTIAVTAYDVDATGSHDQCEGHESWFTYDYMFTGMNEISSTRKNFFCYPNPADQYTTFDISSFTKNGRVVISSMIGEEIKTINLGSKNHSQVDVSDLPCAIYSVSIYSGEEKIASSKLVIAR